MPRGRPRKYSEAESKMLTNISSLVRLFVNGGEVSLSKEADSPAEAAELASRVASLYGGALEEATVEGSKTLSTPEGSLINIVITYSVTTAEASAEAPVEAVAPAEMVAA
jgi:hypothetical protein